MKRPLPCALAACIGVALTGTAHADAVLEYRYQGDECRVEMDRMQVSGSRLRMDTTWLGMDTSAIYDGLEQMLLGLEHREKTYSQMELDDDAQDFQGDVAAALGTRTRKETAKAMDAMAEARAQYEAGCKKRDCPPMPELGRYDDLTGGMDADALLARQEAAMARMDPEMLERMGVDPAEMKAQMDATRAKLAASRRWQDSVATPTGKTRTIDGISCAEIEVHLGVSLIERRCETEPAALPLDARDAKGMERGVARLTQMAQTWRPLGEQVTGRQVQDEHHGLVVEKVCYATDRDGKLRETGRATLGIEKRAVASDAFEIPDGYKPAGFGVDAEALQ